MATAADIQALIDAAEAQRQSVALGTAVVEIQRDGKRMKMQVPTIAELNRYLDGLRADLVAAQIAEGITPTVRRRRPIRLAWR
jgi:hypothetical protein